MLCPYCKNKMNFEDLHDSWQEDFNYTKQEFYSCKTCGKGFEIETIFTISKCSVVDEYRI